jgi:NADP-dependent 3-hydroxy acid dehydrogenase YdfG
LAPPSLEEASNDSFGSDQFDCAGKGASRGFGRAIASELYADCAKVVAVARNAEPLAAVRDELGGMLTEVVADVADLVVAGSLIEQYRPDTLVLNAGAPPLMRPLQNHTWQSFSRNWDVVVWVSASSRYCQG